MPAQVGFDLVFELLVRKHKFLIECVPDGEYSPISNRRLRPVGPEYSYGLRKIGMMKAVDGREFNNVTRNRCSYGTTVRCVAIQGLVCSPRMNNNEEQG